jgi:hypothetical protein
MIPDENTPLDAVRHSESTVMHNELNNNSTTPEKPTTHLNQDQIRQKEACDFLKSAYSAGINIIIEGETNSGRTSLLNTLMNSPEDNQSTILLTTENFVEIDNPEITQIKGDDSAWLIHQARRMDPFRIVMDNFFINEETMENVVSGSLVGTQFVSTGYTARSQFSNSETDPLSSLYPEHPYEIRVHVALQWNDDRTKREFNLVSVSQIVHQKASRMGTNGRQFYDVTSNQLLFNGDRKVADPTRTMRRKIEAAQRLHSSKAKTSQQTLGSSSVDTRSAPTFVSLTPDEKAELLEHRAALHEHFQSQSDTLRKRFSEIEKLLSKF